MKAKLQCIVNVFHQLANALGEDSDVEVTDKSSNSVGRFTLTVKQLQTYIEEVKEVVGTLADEVCRRI